MVLLVSRRASFFGHSNSLTSSVWLDVDCAIGGHTSRAKWTPIGISCLALTVSAIIWTSRARGERGPKFDLAWTEAEGFPYFDGTWHHPQEVVEKLLIPLGRDWEDFAATPQEFLVDGDRVVAFGVYSGIAKATNKPMRAPFAHRWQIRDGKLARFDMYTDTLLIDRAMR